jgi:hypothetical protein
MNSKSKKKNLKSAPLDNRMKLRPQNHQVNLKSKSKDKNAKSNPSGNK